MHFSLTAIALAAASLVSGAALDLRGPFQGRDLTCSSGRRIATFNDLTPLSIPAINERVESHINPYHDLNYTHFAVGAKSTDDNALFYTMTNFAAGPWDWWQKSVWGLIGVNGKLPITAYPPSVIGASPDVIFKLTSFTFGCGIRTGISKAVLSFPCQVIIRPIEASRRGKSHICTFGGGEGQEVCNPTSLVAGRGFTFQTVGRVASLSWLNRWAALINTNVGGTLITGIDNLSYTEYCSFS